MFRTSYAILALSSLLAAAPAWMAPIKLQQANLLTIPAFVTGDEHRRSVHDDRNYLLLQNQDNGFYYYATKDSALLGVYPWSDPEQLARVEKLSHSPSQGEGVTPPQHGNTPLALAVVQNNLQAVEQADKREINQPDSYGTTPLMKAAFLGERAIVEKLLQKGAESQLKDQQQLSALDYAILGQQSSCAELLKSLPLNPTALSSFFWHRQGAEQEQTLKVIYPQLNAKQRITAAVILEKEQFFKQRVSFGQLKEAMFAAARFGKSKLLSEFIRRYRNPNPTDEFGRTPLHWAAEAGQEECVKILLRQRANPGVQDLGERTPLELALMTNRQEIVKALLEAKAPITPGVLAQTSANWEICAKLLNQVGTVDTQHNFQLLVQAIKDNQPEIVRLLLKKGFGKEAKNLKLPTGTPPRVITTLDLARELNYPEIVQILENGK